jgi:hypothetical protein
MGKRKSKKLLTLSLQEHDLFKEIIRFETDPICDKGFRKKTDFRLSQKLSFSVDGLFSKTFLYETDPLLLLIPPEPDLDSGEQLLYLMIFVRTPPYSANFNLKM